ncbi:MAG: UDP-glucose 4-epimerase [candidate division WS2 bacterium]|uniref:UDP-glucose 4-epimerase n=1 Tax=Psychracetigena formicireducens TaxID=2986056 RepID=A0A9E2BIR1_PSYF1|nr:UDP-glucose 4-epimerase [Candidatus Psychracetigena formicireducens]MBT9150878.1 UDP-glucose 4-epimerase [Candidatus Psychracetigena formicireducens]
MNVIAITGATGFIGDHLLDQLVHRKDIQLRILIHKNINNKILNRNNIKIIEGDLLKSETLNKFIIPRCTVVNLVYLSGRSKQESLSAIANLAEACAKAKIKRFIHCSTAVVAGRVPNKVIDENTKCNPISEYEITKLAVENILLEKYSSSFEVAILRPTAVFGPGGKNLLKLANDLRYGNRIINYLKSCLVNYRKMNLVYIDNVVSSIAFLIDTDKKIDREIFIVSDDEYHANNYRDIEQYLMKSFGYKNYLLPRVPLPFFLLIFLLKLAGKSNLNPTSVYDCQKLLRAGFKKPVLFKEGLAYFTDWYKIKFCGNQGSNN